MRILLVEDEPDLGAAIKQTLVRYTYVLVKPFGMAELLARIRALQRRSPQLVPGQLQLGNLVLDYSTNTVWLTGAASQK